MKSWLLVFVLWVLLKMSVKFYFWKVFYFHAKTVKAGSLLKDKHNQPSSHWKLNGDKIFSYLTVNVWMIWCVWKCHVWDSNWVEIPEKYYIILYYIICDYIVFCTDII